MGTIFRSDYTRRSLSGGSTSRQFTNADFRGKADPSLNRSLQSSRIVSQQGIIIIASPIVITFAQIGLVTQWEPVTRNPLLDITFDCSERDRFDTRDAGVVKLEVEILGSWLNETIFASPIEILFEQLGIFPSGVLVVSSPIVITITLPDWNTA